MARSASAWRRTRGRRRRRRSSTAASLSFVDTAVEQGSGTVRARAVVANAEQRWCRASSCACASKALQLRTPSSVPRRAVMSGAQGSFVWVVGAGDAVELRPVRLAGESGDARWSPRACKAGERVDRRRRAQGASGRQGQIAAPAKPRRQPAAPPAAAGPAAVISGLFHRPADLRVGHLGVHRDRRTRGAARAADRAVSGHPAARGRRPRVLSGRQCGDRRGDRRGAARAGDQRRRRHAVHALGERRRRRARP